MPNAAAIGSRRTIRIGGATLLVLGFVLWLNTPWCVYFLPPGGSDTCSAAQTWLPGAGGLAVVAGVVLLLGSSLVPRRVD
jgi:hypothetical protein